MIQFRCHNCGSKIKVAKEHAGKKGKCPKCKNPVVVPFPTPSTSPNQIESPNNISQNNKITNNLFEKPINGNSIQAKSTDEYMQYSSHAKVESFDLNHEQDTEIGERRFIWFLDIFLYPISAPALTMIGIYVIWRIVGPFLGILPLVGFFIYLIITFIIALYMLWYITYCIRDSALGGLRAPETINEMPMISDLFSEIWHVVVCYGALLAPPIIYRAVTDQQDLIWCILLCSGIFLFPMSLLSVVMHDNISGLNPWITLPSIFKTFFPYCGLVALLLGIFYLINKFLITKYLFWGSFISQIAGLYLYLICAHLIGRLYWRYKDKLDWAV